MAAKRAIGVVRVSRVRKRKEDGRPGERFVSPGEQRDRIRAMCKREGLRLVGEPIPEMDTSGGAPLEKRKGLRQAIEMIEAGKADVLVVAYFDRLVRSLRVQAEVVDRVERAGGAVLAADIGEVRADTASRWLSSTMLGMVAEYVRRATQERVADAQVQAVARGVPPFAKIPPGYRKRDDDGRLEPDENEPIVVDAFNMRAAGKSFAEIQAFLADHGIERAGVASVQQMVRSRIYRGELHFGDLVNTRSHQAIVDEITWRRAQSVELPRGPRPKSDRLLARLGVLRCATCDARLVISTRTNGSRSEAIYRCPVTRPCTQRVTISADVAERAIADYVKDAIAGITGTARSRSKSVIKQAEAAVNEIEEELTAAVQAFTGFDDVTAVRDRLTDLRQERERRLDYLADLQSRVAPDVTVTSDDWERLALDERRALIRAVVARATVSPGGRGAERITIDANGV